MVMERKDQLFNIGDLVKISEGTHEESMPRHRTGIIVERVANSVYMIRFTNGQILKFHRMFIRLINRSKDVSK